jgi:hypothetical protein
MKKATTTEAENNCITLLHLYWVYIIPETVERKSICKHVSLLGTCGNDMETGELS